MPVHGEQIGWPTAEALPAYTVYLEAGVYYAFNNTTGAIDFQGADPAVVVQACLTAGGAGTVVGMREANYVALTGVAATANNQGVYGMGEGTYWDATALLTGVHGFTISGFTGCWLRHFAIETLAAGGLVNHCVFIEDGADNFHLVDLTIVDSDSDGIHIEGTTTTLGHIYRCHVEAADGTGIMVDMDGGNFANRFHIEDNDIIGCGLTGIDLATSGGNFYCQIVNNIVYNCGDEGITLHDGNDSMVRGNLCVDNGRHGIEITSSLRAQILGNMCQGNTIDGIFLGTVSYQCLLVGNTCQGNGFDGISLDSASYQGVVTGNSCIGNTENGIRAYISNRSTITGNICVENVKHGISLVSTDFCTVVGNVCEGNDSGDTGNFDGINIDTCDGILVMGNQCHDQQGWGIQVDDDSNWCKISNNYTALNVAGSINVNGAACDGNEVVFNTVEEGAPVDTGTLTRASGNFDPSANAYIAIIGAAPF